MSTAKDDTWAWENGEFVLYRDGANATALWVFNTVSPPVALDAGQTYRLNVPIWWGRGSNSTTAGSVRLEILIGTTSFFDVTTKTSPLGSPGNTTVTASFVAPSSSAAFTFRFSVTGSAMGSDDMKIVLPTRAAC